MIPSCVYSQEQEQSWIEGAKYKQQHRRGPRKLYSRKQKMKQPKSNIGHMVTTEAINWKAIVTGQECKIQL